MAFFSQQALGQALTHFEQRAGQIELSNAIADAIDQHNHLLAEAGTGIGKTLAYLLPTLSRRKKTYVSTATKHLQDQIFFKDLPIVEKALGRKISACLLKGRSNYLCLHRFAQLQTSDLALTSTQLRKLQKIANWADKTQSGDLSEVSSFSESDGFLLKAITSNRENCLGSDCPQFGDCFVQKVREQAKKADIVIVNHALLMADMVLKETGFAEILPDSDVVIIDEAHQLGKVATQAFSEELSGHQLLDLAQEARQLYHDNCPETHNASDKGFSNCCDSLIEAIAALLKACHARTPEAEVRLAEVKNLPTIYSALKALLGTYHDVLKECARFATHDKDWAQCHERTEQMANKIKRVLQSSNSSNESPDHQALGRTVSLFRWNKHSFVAAKVPIYLDNRFQDLMHDYAKSWIFVSATLALAKSFEHFCSQMGLDSTLPNLIVDSPFDYRNQSVMHVMPGLPDPRDSDFTEKMVAQSLPIIRAAQGRTFMLFTSYKALRAAAEILGKEPQLRLFVQGDQPKAQLVDAFIKTKQAVLLGTMSFWEGVDVQGQDLACVIIDKIPFPSPADPLIAEQGKWLAQAGKNAFAHAYIPAAATWLKQGVGRLIRSKTDTGAIVFADRRLSTQRYGTDLLAALPPMRQVNIQDLLQFLEKHC